MTTADESLDREPAVIGPAFSRAFLGPLAHAIMTTVSGLITPTVTVMRRGKNPPDYILRYPAPRGEIVLAAQYNATELSFVLWLIENNEPRTARQWGLFKYEEQDSLVIMGDTPYALAQLHTLRRDVARNLSVSGPGGPELVASIVDAINGYLYPPLPPRRRRSRLAWLFR